MDQSRLNFYNFYKKSNNKKNDLIFNLSKDSNENSINNYSDFNSNFIIFDLNFIFSKKCKNINKPSKLNLLKILNKNTLNNLFFF